MREQEDGWKICWIGTGERMDPFATPGRIGVKGVLCICVGLNRLLGKGRESEKEVSRTVCTLCSFGHLLHREGFIKYPHTRIVPSHGSIDISMEIIVSNIIGILL